VRAFLDDAAGRAWGKLRAARNRRFETRLRHDLDGPAVLLSPHLDDAVIDCWSILRAPGAVGVVNVFSGVPRPGSVAYYDRLAGARDSAVHVRQRIAEDREALSLAGRTPLNLGFLDRQYHGGRPEPSFSQLDAALVEVAGAASLVYAPAALGAPHPDHELVREYALALAAAGMPVCLYADAPYCVVYGWPAWVTGEERGPHLDVDAYWQLSANGTAPLTTPEAAEVVRLSEEEAAAKLAAMRTYREFPVLDRGPVGQLSNPAIHGYEVFWCASS
jgi:LmbE family N-acetylglucosaminyl deacetylase